MGGAQRGLGAPGFSALAVSSRVLTCPAGPVALGGEAGVAAAHLVDGDDAELVVDIRGQLEDGGVDTAWELGMVMPDPGLELVLFELDDVVWVGKEDSAVWELRWRSSGTYTCVVAASLYALPWVDQGTGRVPPQTLRREQGLRALCEEPGAHVR